MGVSIADVENLNRSISGLGQSFVQRRKEEGDKEKEAMEADFRQQMLQAEMRRTQAAEDSAKRLGEGHIDQWLQAEDPDADPEQPPQLSHYTGPPSGLQEFIDKSQSAGTSFKPVQPPTMKPPVMLHLSHPNGSTVAVQVRDAADAKKMADEFQKQGFGAQKPVTPTAGSMQALKGAQELRQIRTQAETRLQQLQDAKASGGPVGDDIDQRIAGLTKMIDQSKADEAFLMKPKDDPRIYTVKTQDIADPTSDQATVRLTQKEFDARQQAKAGNLPAVKTKADRDKLPKGAQYIGPDGKTYTKN